MPHAASRAAVGAATRSPPHVPRRGRLGLLQFVASSDGKVTAMCISPPYMRDIAERPPAFRRAGMHRGAGTWG